MSGAYLSSIRAMHYIEAIYGNSVLVDMLDSSEALILSNNAGLCWVAQSEYYYKTINKKKGTRTLQCSRPRIKKVQQDLLALLNERLSLSKSVTAKKGTSFIQNAALHTGAKHILKLDIRNFYREIDAERVRTIVQKYYPAQAEWFFKCTPFLFIRKFQEGNEYDTCFLPTGAPTSPFISNLAGIPLDEKIEQYLEQNYQNTKYTRYIDDLTISFKDALSSQQMNKIRLDVHNILTDEKWIPHPTKCKWVNPLNDRVTVTGIDIRKDVKVTGRYIKDKVRPMLDMAAKQLVENQTGLYVNYPSFFWKRNQAHFRTFEDIIKIYFNKAAPTLAYIKQVNEEQYDKCISYLKNRINVYCAVEYKGKARPVLCFIDNMVSTVGTVFATKLPDISEAKHIYSAAEALPFIARYVLQRYIDKEKTYNR